MSGGGLNLLVASSAETGKCIKKALKTHFSDLNILRVDTKHALSQALADRQWNLLFSEMELVDFSANELPEMFEDFGLSIPVALIADKGSESVASRCLEYGMCQLVQSDPQYIRYLPATVNALLKRSEQQAQQSLAEQKQLEREEQFIDIFNNTSDLIQCISTDGSFIYTNDAWRKAMGYSREDVESLNLMDILHPESKSSCESRFKHLQAGKELPTIDFKYLTRSGETLHLIGEWGSIMKNGVVTATRGVFRSVTETVRYEQELRDSEARYQALYDLAPDIYTTINEKGEILSINQVGIETLGYSREELLGVHATKIIHPEDRDRVIAHIGKVFLSGKDDEGIEYRKVRKDGSNLWVHQRVRLDENTQDPRLLVVCRDITVRRELQKKLAFHATHDSLTELINRRELETRIQRVLSETTDHDMHIICFLDLDEFKIINDTHGHAAGDELLRQVTSILRENIRSRDTLARLGGDEFVVLMEHCPLDAAVKLAKKLQTLIAEFEFHWRAEYFSVGVSIGVSRLKAGSTVEQALSAADAACYKAKENGRNCIEIDERL